MRSAGAAVSTKASKKLGYRGKCPVWMYMDPPPRCNDRLLDRWPTASQTPACSSRTLSSSSSQELRLSWRQSSSVSMQSPYDIRQQDSSITPIAAANIVPMIINGS